MSLDFGVVYICKRCREKTYLVWGSPDRWREVTNWLCSPCIQWVFMKPESEESEVAA